MLLRTEKVRISAENVSPPLSYDLKVQNVDLNARIENGDLKTTVTKKLIERKRKGFRIFVDFNYEMDIDSANRIAFLNQLMTIYSQGSVIKIAFLLSKTPVETFSTPINMVLDPSTDYSISFRNQVLESARPKIVLKSQELLSAIPTDIFTIL